MNCLFGTVNVNSIILRSDIMVKIECDCCEEMKDDVYDVVMCDECYKLWRAKCECSRL